MTQQPNTSREEIEELLNRSTPQSGHGWFLDRIRRGTHLGVSTCYGERGAQIFVIDENRNPNAENDYQLYASAPKLARQLLTEIDAHAETRRKWKEAEARVKALEARQMVRTRARIEFPRALLNEAAKPPYQKILAFTSLGNMLFDLLERAGLNPQIDADVEARPHEFSAFFVDVYKGSAGRSKPGTVVTGKLVAEGVE